MIEQKTVAWFSAGVSSAVATKLAVLDGVVDEILYTHIEDQHPDTLRFIEDCQEWIGKKIQFLASPYKNVENAVTAGGSRYVNGPHGANCTRWLKRRVRREWEVEQIERGEKLTYIWGMDATEVDRADRLREIMRDVEHRFPLIEQGIHKAAAHEILKASGIARPAMYEMGYHNNNCIGCLKGGMGYWNKIRVDFPAVFASRAAMERRIGGTCIKGVYLDELDPERGRHAGPICDDCGIMCELQKL